MRDFLQPVCRNPVTPAQAQGGSTSTLVTGYQLEAYNCPSVRPCVRPPVFLTFAVGSRTGEITASAARGMPAQAEQHISASSLNEKLHPQTRRTSSFRGWHRMACQPRFSARAIQEWSKPISRPCGAPLPSNMPLKASRCLPSEVRSSLARPSCMDDSEAPFSTGACTRGRR